MSRNESESCPDGAFLHGMHLFLHFVEIEVQCGVFLPNAKGSDDSHIYLAVGRISGYPVDLDQFLGLSIGLTGQSLFRYELLDDCASVQLLNDLCDVGA